jgi:hypothetical protein
VSRRRRGEEAPENAKNPEKPRKSKCMGVGELAPPKVHTLARPVQAADAWPTLRVDGRANTLRVLSLWLEVTRSPREGQTAKPAPFPHGVARAGSNTKEFRSTAIGEVPPL